jgi:hypothetical protein
MVGRGVQQRGDALCIPICRDAGGDLTIQVLTARNRGFLDRLQRAASSFPLPGNPDLRNDLCLDQTIRDGVLKARQNLGDKIVLKLDSRTTRSNSPKTQNPRFPNSEIPVFAGSIALKAGASARAACWFESHFILYSYMAVLEVILY